MLLNLGCADVQPQGWINADRDDRWEAVAADPLDGLPWDDDVFSGAVCNHVLQAVAWESLVPFLVEVRRVLVPGAPLRLLVPDLLRGVQAFLDGDPTMFSISDTHETSIDGCLCLWVSQAGATRSVFTPSWLRELAHRAGFEHTAFCENGQSATPMLADLDSRDAESIILECW